MVFSEQAIATVSVDEIDRKLLTLLQADSQQKYAELGEQLHLSPAAVYERVKKMRRSGVLRRYSVEVDPAALGFGICAFVNVYLRCASCEDLAGALVEFPEVEEFYSVAGDVCILIRARTETPKALEAFLTALRRLPGVERTKTNLVLERYAGRGWRTI